MDGLNSINLMTNNYENAAQLSSFLKTIQALTDEKYAFDFIISTDNNFRL